MRWGLLVTLRDVSQVQRADGSFGEEAEETQVYANARTMGATAWMAARAAGLHADASIEVRAADYAGQAEAVVDGTVYEVERAAVSGEFATLTLKRRLRS